MAEANETKGPPRILLVGAGDRGRNVYGAWIARHPDKARLVGVAEPQARRRADVVERHRLGPQAARSDWRELLADPPAADACIVATQDGDHVGPAVAALDAGYDVLLEKPMATTADDCRLLVETAESRGQELRICHVLRHTDFFRAVKRTLDEGRLGRILHISHSENVSYWHFAHSYVRGNWADEGEASPLVLAKTCHDLDLLQWFVGVPAKSVQSFGSLDHFRPENAPPGAPDRCFGSASGTCPHSRECLWYAPRLYQRGEDVVGAALRSRNPLWRLAGRGFIAGSRALSAAAGVLPGLRDFAQWREWPATVLCEEPDAEKVATALATGRYGRCVYRCGNNAPDHQVVSIQFENRVTATMTVHGLSDDESRLLRIEGSEATLVGKFGFSGERLELHEHRVGRRRIIHRRGFSLVGHGGGDALLMDDFVASLRKGEKGNAGLTSARASLESHLLAFAADRSRREGRLVRMDEFR